ncbi:hypothetical protein, partial [Armatimonas sp.]|uniref:hypothetical protein n=1 Tax=Armatimonas sp. TaxID=1872638 RepID=UPI00286B784B
MALVGNDFDGSILLPGPTTDAQGNLNLSLSDTAPYGIWEFYAPLERTRERKLRRTPLSTTQVFEFANDLDTGRLGEGQRIVPITAKAGSELVARLTGTYGEGSVLVELRDGQNRGVAAATAQRGRAVVLRAR